MILRGVDLLHYNYHTSFRFSIFWLPQENNNTNKKKTTKLKQTELLSQSNGHTSTEFCSLEAGYAFVLIKQVIASIQNAGNKMPSNLQ